MPEPITSPDDSWGPLACPECGYQFPDTDADDLPVPSPSPLVTLAGYELLEELGRGGMGMVHKARQVSLDRIVAVKQILSGAWASAQERERFRSED